MALKDSSARSVKGSIVLSKGYCLYQSPFIGVPAHTTLFDLDFLHRLINASVLLEVTSLKLWHSSKIIPTSPQS